MTLNYDNDLFCIKKTKTIFFYIDWIYSIAIKLSIKASLNYINFYKTITKLLNAQAFCSDTSKKNKSFILFSKCKE